MMVMVLAVGPLAGGCGDSLAPADLDSVIGAQDLAVWVPPPAQVVGKVESMPIAWPAEWKVTAADGNAFIRGSTGDSTGGTSAYIAGTFVVAGWDGDELWYEYGMSGMGTGYAMVPTVRILKADGSTMLSETGSGIKLHLSPIPVSFTPAMREVIRTGIPCGLTANVSVEFRSFTGIEFEAFNLAFSASRTQRAATTQPGCPPSPPGSGAPGGGSGGYITYCRYEAWYTSWGELIAIEFLGCTSSPINAA